MKVIYEQYPFRYYFFKTMQIITSVFGKNKVNDYFSRKRLDLLREWLTSNKGEFKDFKVELKFMTKKDLKKELGQELQ